MKHIVLFKFLKNNELEKLGKILNNTYFKLKNEYNVIKDYSYSLNVLENDVNMHLILFVDLENESSLPTYINHPLHQEFLVQFKEAGLCDKAVIDINM